MNFFLVKINVTCISQGVISRHFKYFVDYYVQKVHTFYLWYSILDFNPSIIIVHNSFIIYNWHQNYLLKSKLSYIVKEIRWCICPLDLYWIIIILNYYIQTVQWRSQLRRMLLPKETKKKLRCADLSSNQTVVIEPSSTHETHVILTASL